jgi:DNA polymerase-3 subunit alpha
MKIKSIEKKKIMRASAMPDIDIDFEGKRRDDVKKYIEDKYGLQNVCSIGTYNRMKSKSAIKDMARVEGADFVLSNSVTKALIEKSSDPLNWGQVFEQAQQNPKIKSFIKKYPKVFKFLKPVLLQTRSASIHASAVVIVPENDMEGNKMKIWDWIPVRKYHAKNAIISEWEGKYMDIAGYLKEDILGIAQLDKFKYILELIKINRNEEIIFSDIPMDDKETYDYFKKGWNEDVFQFGTGGLKSYCDEVKPENIEDLIAINALYRPGPMNSGAHKDFVKIRRGLKKPEFDKGMKEVTKSTAGLYIYQEQVMQAMVVAGFSLVESDNARNYIKKFDKDNLAKMREKFIEGYDLFTNNKKESEKVWDKLMSFSSYGFNKAHAAAYSVMGYWSQYLKVHYPLEFWTASLNFCKFEEETPNRISEIIKTKQSIFIKPPDVNKSENKIVCDKNNNSIYYSLVSIKNVGDVASESILSERRLNGQFYSLEEFVKRVNKSKVNKRVVTHLILSGAFDETCFSVNSTVIYRLNILKEYYALIRQPLPEEFNEKETNKELYWKVRQKELTGLGKIDYLKAATDKGISINVLKNYIDWEEFSKNPKFNKLVTVGMKVIGIKERFSIKVNIPYFSLTLESNNGTIPINIWENNWKKNKNGIKIENSLKNKSFLLIQAYTSDYNQLSLSDGTFGQGVDESNFKIIEL